MIQKCVIILVTKPGTYVQAKPKEEKKEETKKHEKEPEGPPDYYRMFKDRNQKDYFGSKLGDTATYIWEARKNLKPKSPPRPARRGTRGSSVGRASTLKPPEMTA